MSVCAQTRPVSSSERGDTDLHQLPLLAPQGLVHSSQDVATLAHGGQCRSMRTDTTIHSHIKLCHREVNGRSLTQDTANIHAGANELGLFPKSGQTVMTGMRHRRIKSNAIIGNHNSHFAKFRINS